MTENIVEVERVSKNFSDQKPAISALKKVSFSIAKGSSLSITGASGSGKSTLLHLLGLLELPSEGEIRINGKNTANFSENEQALFRNETIGFVFQNFNLLPKLTVLENVMLPFLFSKRDFKNKKAKALKAIEEVGLTERRNFETRFLSGGEKQRTAIARALMPQPKIILADEPTGNLDSATGKKVVDLLFKLQKKAGITLVIVTHNLELAKKADKTIHIKDGQIC